MNCNDAKKNADEKLAKMGYEHPSTAKYCSTPQYMSYSVTDEQKKREKPGEYVSQTNYDPYATFDSNGENTARKIDICPKCEQKAMCECSCELQDMMCASGHIWYTKNNKVVLGDPHEGEDDD